MKNIKDKIKPNLHVTYTLPGSIHVPAPITIINEKLDLIERLKSHHDSHYASTKTTPGYVLKSMLEEMIAIEYVAIEQIIYLDK